ncbi:MAG: rRNA maturation RNase YbeY [Peptococcaceae bacterium]|nr:rRNA maturation RNase YbeY [Peptococcaceae bacterium]MBQ3509676.1 rRNA maturation RNase YbeY [Peptococcaceae bacterium]MBR2628018.1 rRNA maturation RNase YbeY [Peptococcaceae bacterium]
MTVVITNEQDKIEIPADWEEKINKVAAICLKEEQIPEEAEVDLLFVDNETIREMNREYRDKDSATDVLSFPMYEADEEIDDEDEILFGDIVISLERAQEQCEEYGHSLEREVMYLLVHGLLHLAGYDHMEEEEKKEMRAQEEKLLAVIGAIR